MQTHAAESTFRSRLKDAGIDLDETVPRQGFEALLDFYRDVRADDVALDDDGDMLLFQWGTFDWGDGRHFELNLTRQLIVEPGGDDNLWQLSLTYRYEPDDELEELGEGNEWCPHPDGLDEFVAFVEDSEPYSTLRGRAPVEVTLGFEVVG